MKALKNDYCYISYSELHKSITGGDKTDPNNDPSFYTKSKRGLKKAWEEIENKFTNETKFGDITTILMKTNIDYRQYCARD